MKFFKDKNKYVDEKEVRLRKFLLKNKNNYSSDEYDYLINHYGDYYYNPEYAYDILIELYSKFGIISKEKDLYYGIFNKINDIYGLNRDVVEVASGTYPRLAEIIGEYQSKNKFGSIKTYDPKIVISSLKNVEINKCNFSLDTPVKKDSLLVATFPCEVTLDIIRKANNNDLEFLIALCGCTHDGFNNYEEWEDYVFDFANQSSNNSFKIYTDSLDEAYSVPWKLIYKVKNT